MSIAKNYESLYSSFLKSGMMYHKNIVVLKCYF